MQKVSKQSQPSKVIYQPMNSINIDWLIKKSGHECENLRIAFCLMLCNVTCNFTKVTLVLKSNLLFSCSNTKRSFEQTLFDRERERERGLY